MRDGSDQRVDSSHDQDNQNRSESTPLYLNAPDTGTFRLIVGFFAGFSITVTLALAAQIYYGHTRIALHGSVVSDSKLCSEAGVSMLRDGGSAVDAVIATAFCMGVVNPHVTGLGSGGYMLVYDQRERKLASAIDFRVTRSNHTTIGVPGFVAGLALAHELYGVLPWNLLINPSEHFARSGFQVSQTLLKSVTSLMQGGKDYNVNLKSELSGLVLDEVITNQKLADTLKYVATSGPAEFYKNILVNDLSNYVDPRDVLEYKALKVAGIKDSYMNYDIITPGEGSGGPLLLKNLKLLNNSLSPLVSAVLGFKNVAEKWQISTASHIAAVDNNDVYVTMVSGLGYVLGSQILTKSGFILNNMIAVTNSEKQRPDVLLTPIVALQRNKICGRRLLLGAGDVRDAVQALVYILRNESGSSIAADIEAPRVRLRTPNLDTDPDRTISFEELSILKKEFINITESSWLFPSINGIEKINDTIFAHADTRGGGNYVIF